MPWRAPRPCGEALATVLKGAYLFAGEWGPDELINWCAQVLNANRLLKGEAQHLAYDDGRLIRDQILPWTPSPGSPATAWWWAARPDSAEAVAACRCATIPRP